MKHNFKPLLKIIIRGQIEQEKLESLLKSHLPSQMVGLTTPCLSSKPNSHHLAGMGRVFFLVDVIRVS